MNLNEVFFELEDLASPGLSACPGCPAELALRIVLKIVGNNTLLGVTPGCMTGAGAVGWNRLSGVKVPVTMPLLTNAASLFSGVKRFCHTQGRDDIRVVVFAGDGATADAGFQALSGAAERNENILYICYDNEGYMNTGFQRSGTSSKGSYTSTTPVGSVIKGKQQNKKDMPLIMAMHDAAYVATLSTAYTRDFVNKVEKALTIKEGFVYLHIFSPCLSGWRYESKNTISVGRLAVQTNFYPLYEYREGRFTQTVKVKNVKPIQEFLNSVGKFKHFDEKQTADIQQWVDRRYSLLESLWRDS